MTFFIDNNLSQQLARGMREFGENVTHLEEHLAPDTGDPVWLEHIGKQGWTLITRDDRVRFRPAEIQAIHEHRVGAFFLGGRGRSRCDLIQQLIRSWPRIKQLAVRTNRPFCAPCAAVWNKVRHDLAAVDHRLPLQFAAVLDFERATGAKASASHPILAA